LEDFEKKIDFHKETFIENGSRHSILHLEDINRNQKVFRFLNDPIKKSLYLTNLNELIANLDFSIISVFIDKRKLLRQYGSYAYHPLVLSYHLMFERLEYLNSRESTSSIVFLERFQVASSGFFRHTGMEYDEFLKSIPRSYSSIRSVHVIDKKDNLSGIQIADLCATPLKRSIEGLPEIGVSVDILKQKCDRDSKGNIEGYGIKVFPL
jgi:hypothetical protein